MIFNSVEYAVFLAVVLALYYALSTRGQNVMLLGASYLFYGWWDYRFLTLLWISTLVDYFCAISIERSSGRPRKLLLLISCVTNLGILGFFKYFNFFADSTVTALQWAGLEPSPVLLQIVLPMGISFYTFQTLSYTVDVYRGQLKAHRDFLSFALYVSYFPQLVAGPIERAGSLLPQLTNKRVVTARQVDSGSFLILLGLFKKVGVADAIAPLVDARFGSPEAFQGADLLLGVYLFAIQIYCDFSGYSDIARGSSRLLGIELMVNFRQPYFASSITDFWRRWHISLSSWLRDYLYIPLGGNRHGAVRTYRNLMITMLLGGLWHGASWAFIFWGGLHGIYLAVNRRFPLDKTKVGQLVGPHLRFVVGLVLTFHLVCLAWVFFRASSFAVAWNYLAGIASLETLTDFGSAPWLSGRNLVLVFTLLLIDFCQNYTDDECFVFRLPAVVRGLSYGTLILITLVLGGVDTDVPFIYFQF